MSYSFNVRAPSKALAKEMTSTKLDEVAVSQPPHQKDKGAAQAACNAFIDILDEDETRDVIVHVNGSLSGNWEGLDLKSFSAANISISAFLNDKLPVV